MRKNKHIVIEAPATVIAPKDPAKVGDLNIAPTTTAAEDLTKASQRAINQLWENTQMKIALGAVYVALFVAAVVVVFGMLPWANPAQIALAVTAFVLLSNLATLVIGFYFGRTNHTRSSGSGDGKSGSER